MEKYFGKKNVVDLGRRQQECYSCQVLLCNWNIHRQKHQFNIRRSRKPDKITLQLLCRLHLQQPHRQICLGEISEQLTCSSQELENSKCYTSQSKKTFILAYYLCNPWQGSSIFSGKFPVPCINTARVCCSLLGYTLAETGKIPVTEGTGKLFPKSLESR